MADNIIEWSVPGPVGPNRHQLRTAFWLRVLMLTMLILLSTAILGVLVHTAGTRAAERNSGLRGVKRPQFPVPKFSAISSTVVSDEEIVRWHPSAILDRHLLPARAPAGDETPFSTEIKKLHAALFLHDARRANEVIAFLQAHFKNTGSHGLSKKRAEETANEKQEIARMLDRVVLPALALEIHRKSWIAAADLSAVSSALLKLLDSDPNQNVKYLSFSQVNAILFYEVLFYDLRPAFLRPEPFARVARIIAADGEAEFLEIANVGANTDAEGLREFGRYAAALALFRTGEFETAARALSELSGATKNGPLRELSLLVQARAIYWRYKTSAPAAADQKKTLLELREIVKKITRESFLTDVGFYIDEVS